MFNLNLPSFSLKPCSLLLYTTSPCAKSLSSFLVGPLQVLEDCYKVFLQSSLLQAEQPQLSRLFFIGEVLPPFVRSDSCVLFLFISLQATNNFAVSLFSFLYAILHSLQLFCHQLRIHKSYLLHS